MSETGGAPRESFFAPGFVCQYLLVGYSASIEYVRRRKKQGAPWKTDARDSLCVRPLLELAVDKLRRRVDPYALDAIAGLKLFIARHMPNASHSVRYIPQRKVLAKVSKMHA